MFPDYIEKILRYFLGERRLVEVILYPYTGCDVLCKHCSDVEKFTNQTMSVELVEKLLKQSKWSWYQLVVVLMGAGEPLLCKNFVPIMEKLLASPLVNIVKLITSGFSNSEFVKAERFNKLLESPNLKKCKISHSFNLYHETFPERLKNAIHAMLGLHDRCILDVGMAVSQDNVKETREALEDVLKQVEIGQPHETYPVVIGKELLDEYSMIRHMHAIKRFNFGLPRHYLSLLPQWYVISGETKKMGIKSITFPVQYFGGGKCLGEKLFGNERCDSFVNTVDDPVHIYIGPDGACYPDVNCFGVPHMLIGNLNKEKLSKLFARKKEIIRSLVADVMRNPDKNLSICQAHQTMCRQKTK